jgi:MoxR-like ATPase
MKKIELNIGAQLFTPPEVFKDETKGAAKVADEREGAVYVFDRDITLAINVAMATGRPILVRGASGAGKSSLARSAANVLNWRYYERVITSRTQARDLLYEVDLLRRLHDAQVSSRDEKPFSDDLTPYISPGVLWWAFNVETARNRGAKPGVTVKEVEPPKCEHPNGPRAVVLLDEIDKADPDVPNNLLVPLGSLEFPVEETGARIQVDAGKAPLVFITSNDERDLPAAFLRRCVELNIPAADRDKLEAIGKAHFKDKNKWIEHATRSVIPDGMPQNDLPSAAEYLDVLRAFDELEVPEDSEHWEKIKSITVRKWRRQGGGAV